MPMIGLLAKQIYDVRICLLLIWMLLIGNMVHMDQVKGELQRRMAAIHWFQEKRRMTLS